MGKTNRWIRRSNTQVVNSFILQKYDDFQGWTVQLFYLLDVSDTRPNISINLYLCYSVIYIKILICASDSCVSVFDFQFVICRQGKL